MSILDTLIKSAGINPEQLMGQAQQLTETLVAIRTGVEVVNRNLGAVYQQGAENNALLKRLEERLAALSADPIPAGHDQAPAAGILLLPGNNPEIPHA